jgi:hypothetical protein
MDSTLIDPKYIDQAYESISAASLEEQINALVGYVAAANALKDKYPSWNDAPPDIRDYLSNASNVASVEALMSFISSLFEE